MCAMHDMHQQASAYTTCQVAIHPNWSYRTLCVVEVGPVVDCSINPEDLHENGIFKALGATLFTGMDSVLYMIRLMSWW